MYIIITEFILNDLPCSLINVFILYISRKINSIYQLVICCTKHFAKRYAPKLSKLNYRLHRININRN